MVPSQFHYGSITTFKFTNRQRAKRFCLNSTMVRLQLIESNNTNEEQALSQFHYGSITTRKLLKYILVNLHLSQFHYGSITTENI